MTFEPDRYFDQAEHQLTQQYNDGELSLTQYNAEMRELQRDYQAMADEAAWDAYDNERSRW